MLPAARATVTPTSYPGGTWEPGPATYGQSQDTNLSVRASDGAILKLDVLYPTDLATGARLAGPFPVILNQDPYTAGATSAASTSTALPPNYFVQHGYIYVHLHQRGTGGPGVKGSEGAADLSFGPRHGLDGVEVAYWAADPANVRGSNGVVGLQGCSALGIVQLSTLAALGRALRLGEQVHVPGSTIDDAGSFVSATDETNPIKASIPECFATSIYREQFTDNGVATTQFSAAFLAGAAQPLLFGFNVENVAAGLDGTSWSLDMQTGGDRGYDRAFWQERDWLRRAEDIGRTGVPLLMQVGYLESGFTSAQPLFAALQNYAAGRPVTAPMLPNQPTVPEYQVIIGNWGHGGGISSGVDLEWFETWMRGVNTGLQSTPGAVHLEELSSTGTTRWISPSSFPMTDAYQALFLGSGGLTARAGTLSSQAPQAAADKLAWQAGPPLTYTSAPFSQDTTLLGPATAELWVSSTTTNGQIYVELQDVAPDGSAVEITHGSLLASRAQLDPVRSWTASNGLPARSWLTLDDDRFLTPNRPVKLDIPLQPRSWRLGVGHSLRVLIAANPGSRCAPTQNVLAAPIPYGCVVSASLVPSLTGSIVDILHDGLNGRASFLSAALVPSAQIPTTPSAPVTPGGPALPQGW